MSRLYALLPVALYTALLFVSAHYLPLWTKQAAAALTWEVYARLLKSVMAGVALVTLTLVLWRWRRIVHRWLFLAVAALWSVAAGWLVHRLAGSVNEYVHFPEYALLALLWHRALERWSVQNGRGFRNRFVPARTALAGALAALTGVLEETSQLFIPLRHFDWQDILLNLMGAAGGMLLLWALIWRSPGQKQL